MFKYSTLVGVIIYKKKVTHCLSFSLAIGRLNIKNLPTGLRAGTGPVLGRGQDRSGRTPDFVISFFSKKFALPRGIKPQENSERGIPFVVVRDERV